VDFERGGLELNAFVGWQHFSERNDPAPLLGELTAHPRPVVFDWGFPPILWPRVAQLISAGMTAWWFEADRLAARAQFIARADVPLWAFDNQCAGIAAAWNEIAPLYPGRIIRNLSADGCFRNQEELAVEILGAARHQE
jgi:hypothetical protein